MIRHLLLAPKQPICSIPPRPCSCPFPPPLSQTVHRLLARGVSTSAQLGWSTGNNGLLQRLIHSHRNANHANWRQPHMVCVAPFSCQEGSMGNSSEEALSVLPHAACHAVLPVTKAIRCTCTGEAMSLWALPPAAQSSMQGGAAGSQQCRQGACSPGRCFVCPLLLCNICSSRGPAPQAYPLPSNF